MVQYPNTHESDKALFRARLLPDVRSKSKTQTYIQYKNNCTFAFVLLMLLQTQSATDNKSYILFAYKQVNKHKDIDLFLLLVD